MAASSEKLPNGNSSLLTPPVRSAAALGALVRARRRQLALSQLDLAGLGNTGNRFIVDLENGKPTLQLQMVLDALHLLGLEVCVRAKTAKLP